MMLFVVSFGKWEYHSHAVAFKIKWIMYVRCFEFVFFCLSLFLPSFKLVATASLPQVMFVAGKKAEVAFKILSFLA